jgi:hypothetical protein
MLLKDLVPEYCHGLESSAVYTSPPFFVESVHCGSNRCLPCMPMHMHAEDIVPTVVTSNINIGICQPKALTPTRLWLYKMNEWLSIVRLNKCVGLRGILNSHLLRDTFPYWLARGIPL